MNRNIEAVVNFLLILAIVLFVSCKKEQLDPVQTEQKVKVETSSVTQITSSSAIVGGDVTFDGGSFVRERGVCWSKTPSPIIGGNHESLGTGVGAFTYNLTELEPATNYYVRAYAINDAGINYGRVVGFSTLYKVSDGTCNGHDYVDLGLPSGTLWATCNVGANVPEEYGDLFAWGEVEPKSDYSWNTYKYCNNGNSHQLTRPSSMVVNSSADLPGNCIPWTTSSSRVDTVIILPGTVTGASSLARYLYYSIV